MLIARVFKQFVLVGCVIRTFHKILDLLDWIYKGVPFDKNRFEENVFMFYVSKV